MRGPEKAAGGAARGIVGGATGSIAKGAVSDVAGSAAGVAASGLTSSIVGGAADGEEKTSKVAEKKERGVARGIENDAAKKGGTSLL